MRHLEKLLFFPLMILAGACETVPEYPTQPSISYGSAYFKEMPQTDYIYLSLNFKDGDGDLGLNSEELAALDSADRFNIFPVLYRKNGDQYEEMKEISYAGTFPRLRESLVTGPIEGTIQYKLGSLNFFNEDSSIAKIRVYIRDRAGNSSNVIETAPFPVVYK
jgi:hypothetical protein